MNKRDFYSKFFISQVETSLLSKTYADYAKNMAEKASSKIAYITDFDNQLTSSSLNIDTSSIMLIPCEGTTGGTSTCSVTVSMLKASLSDAVTNGRDQFVVYDSEGVGRSVNVNTLSDFFSNTVGQLQITQFAYSSIDMENSGGYFIDTLQGLNVNLDSYGPDFKALAQNVHDTLSTVGATAIDKLSQLSRFFGFNAANSDAATLMSNDFDVTQYTGVNPVQAWAAGLDIRLTSISNIADAFVKIARKVWSGISNVTTALFKSATKYISETFVDPVDYQVQGDTIGYFSTPAKIVVNNELRINNPPDGNSAQNLSAGLAEFRNFMIQEGELSPYFINCHSVMYRVLRYGDEIYYERYVRPINYRALYKDLMSINYYTVEGCYNLFDTLERNDYFLPSSTPELEVYRGIIFSYALSSIWNYCLYNSFMSQRVGSEIGEAYGDFISGTTANSALYDIAALFDQLKVGIAWCLNPQGLTPGVPTFVGTLTDELGLSSVTNVDFIKLLTKSMYLVNDIETALDVSNISDYANSTINGYTRVSKAGQTPSYSSAANMLMYHYPILFFGFKRLMALYYENTYGLIYMPYLHDTNLNMDINAIVKTDQLNAQAIDNLFNGILIAAAVITTFLIAKKVIFGFKASIIANTAVYNSKSIQLANAIAKGDTTLSKQLTNEMDILLKKNKLNSAALGIFGLSVSDAAAQINNTSASLGENITDGLEKSSESLRQSLNNIIDEVENVKSLIR